MLPAACHITFILSSGLCTLQPESQALGLEAEWLCLCL